MAELADALDLGSSGYPRGGSTPPSRTISYQPKNQKTEKHKNLTAKGTKFMQSPQRKIIKSLRSLRK